MTTEKETKKEENSETQETKNAFTVSEIKAHKTDKDCWVIIHGNVYDVTKYLDDHPGGPEILLDVAGTDATGDFEDTGHTSDARDILKTFMIGTLKPGEPGSSTTTVQTSSKSSPNFVIFLTSGLAILAAIAVFYQEEIAAYFST